MTYVSEVGDAPEDGDGPYTRLPQGIQRYDSYDSISPETYLPDFGSDELDKLSSCLSEVSSDSGKETSTSIFYDVIQAQLTLWTCVFSILYSYAWGQHRKKFIMSIFFVIPTVFTVCCCISCLLTALVILGRIFSTPIAYKDFLTLSEQLTNRQDTENRRRTYSGASEMSLDDCLPKPLCRRHSSHGSLCSRPPSVNRKLSYCYTHYNSQDGDDTD